MRDRNQPIQRRRPEKTKAYRDFARFRARLLKAVTDEDFDAVVKVLVAQAKAGQKWAIQELLDRTTGKAATLQEETSKSKHTKAVLLVVREEDRKRLETRKSVRNLASNGKETKDNFPV